MSGALTFWIVLASVALFLELITRTFALMMPAIGFGAAALLAWLDFGLVLQAVAAGTLLFFGLRWLHRSSAGKSLHEAEESRYSVFDDDGEEVSISEWDDANSVNVVFKGRTWEARLAAGEMARQGRYTVREVREGRLILEMKRS